MNSMPTEADPTSAPSNASRATVHAGGSWHLWVRLALFLGAAAFAFLFSTRTTNIYDEGILLTGAMRIMAGQVIHRDFYYIYGPAQAYLLAGLFRLFGPSVFVERIVWAIANGALTLSVYCLARRCCSRSVAVAATLLWLPWTSLYWIQTGEITVPVLWATWWISRIFRGELDRKAMVIAGLLVGVAGLFRYDVGLGLIAAHVVVVAVAALSCRKISGWRSRFAAESFGFYLLGVVIVVAPFFVAYLAVAPLHDFLYDIFIFSSKYYRLGRHVPYPGISWSDLEQGVVYLLPLIIALALAVSLPWLLLRFPKRFRTMPFAGGGDRTTRLGFVAALSMVALVMYAKGVVRISAGQVSFSIAPSILVLALLFRRRSAAPLVAKIVFGVLTISIGVCAVAAMVYNLNTEHHQRASTLRWILSHNSQAPLPPLRGWCRESNPITRGFCYVTDDDRIRSIEYLEQHTAPGDTLFVGVPHLDVIYANDSLTYFATQRLPATKWSHFDPLLQNRADIQREMIAEFERNRPPYVVLDGEFSGQHEPNASSVSTGVHLLDHYFADHYQQVQQFGFITILKRR